MRHHRGNVLVMAIFIAVFLFFLSVALVTANRQDILLALTVDHRLRAQLAARAGSEICLVKLRETENPEQAVSGYSEELASGAHVKVKLQEYDGSYGGGGDKLLKQLVATGSSGFLGADRTFVLEEVGLGLEEIGGLPFLFGKDAGGNLYALGPSFKWTSLGALPRPDSWLAAHGGPLHVMAPLGTADKPPDVYDFNLQPGPAGTFVPTIGEASPLTTTPHEHLLYLTFDGQAVKWVDIPDPNDLKGTGLNKPATIDGKPDGVPHWATVTAGPQTVTYTDSQYQGPLMEWWGLDGPGLAAEEGTVYCHATHYFYRGLTFQNNVQVVAGAIVNNPTKVDAKLFAEPCVLAYDGGKWNKVVDLMRVDDPLGEPVISRGPRPNKATLATVSNKVYAFQGNDPTQLLVGGQNDWSPSQRSQGISQGVVTYGGKVRLYEAGGQFLDQNTQRTIVDGLNPNLVYQRDEVVGEYRENGSFQDISCEQALAMELDLLPGLNNGASYGKDFYTFARLKKSLQEPSCKSVQELMGGEKPVASSNFISVLVHYNSDKGWQVWPMGMQGYQTIAADSERKGLEVGAGGTLDIQQLAVGAYKGKEDRLSHWVPVLIAR